MTRFYFRSDVSTKERECFSCKKLGRFYRVVMTDVVKGEEYPWIGTYCDNCFKELREKVVALVLMGEAEVE